MNTYEIEGQRYEARNEYEAVKKAYKMASSWRLFKYICKNSWAYEAIFTSGRSMVVVSRIG